MMRKGRWAWVTLGGLVLFASCGHRVSDTGYVGTWSRGSKQASSTISISKQGDRYRFFWNLVQNDGQWTVKCDKDSRCIETCDGKKSAEYQFSTRVDPETGHLIVRGDSTVFGPKGEFKRYDIDELIVDEGGLKLTSYTIERDGTKMKRGEGPLRSFQKVSDDVMDPGT